MPPRSKAFSGKQKKEQLKEKRAGKHRGASSDSDSDDALDEVEAPQKHVKAAAVSVPTATLGADKKGIRSAFVKESDSDIRARKRLSYLPLVDRRANPAIPFGEWFKMAFEGNPDELNHIQCPFERNAFLALDARRKSASDAGASAPSDGKAVYRWKDAPVSLPLPLPAEVDFSGTPHHLSAGEVESLKVREAALFDRWMRTMQTFEAKEKGAINQYEQNLDVWRQLWFTVDHSDVVMLITDCRYPIFHIPMSLVRFVIVAQRKKLLIVLNKADLLPATLLEQWTVFTKSMVAAFLHREKVKNPEAQFEVVGMCCTPDTFVQDVAEGGQFGSKRRKVNNTRRKQADYRQVATLAEELQGLNHGSGSDEDSSDDDAEPTFKGKHEAERDEIELARQEKARTDKYAAVGRAINHLLQQCHTLAGHTGPTAISPLGIGLIGHPNVGKSSLINAIKGVKTVSVSATPGHTKHMQTVNLGEDNAVLYDCPGLCFPSLGVPRPLQAVLGTHQIAQQRDPASGVGFLARHLQLEKIYGLKKLYDDEEHWSAHEFCEAYALKRGYRTRGKGGGAPDVHRGAISILQEAYAGRLVLYFVPPPLEKAAQLAQECDDNCPLVD